MPRAAASIEIVEVALGVAPGVQGDGSAAEVVAGVGSSRFPLVIENTREAASLKEALHWVHGLRSELDHAASATGAVLFRGFPVGSARDFDAFVQAFGFSDFSYAESLSNAVRRNETDRVFTANEAPPEATIGLHHEMAQTPVRPSRLFFYCEKPAERGGATSLCRSDWLFEALAERAPVFAADCERAGLRYSLVMPPEDDAGSPVGRSWRSTFGTDDRSGVEARMRRLGYDWQWLDGDCLRTTTPLLPAVHRFADGRRSLLNQLIAARSWQDDRNVPATAVRFGDGRALPDEAWALVGELADELTFDLEWQPGDVALVDNRLVLHGRRHFEGTRRVLASFTAPEPSPG